MKLKISKEEVKGVLSLDMRHILVDLEYKWFLTGNQINFRILNIKYKMKDPLLRKRYTYDFLQAHIQNIILGKLKKTGLLAILHNEEHMFVDPTVVWWE